MQASPMCDCVQERLQWTAVPVDWLQLTEAAELLLNAMLCCAVCWCRWTAAASRPLVLKQCLQLPKPLWKEMLALMGGEYATAAKEDVME